MNTTKFKNLIPPLTEQEYQQLEENCIKEGIREPILTWNDNIIDGHNRYNIATKNFLEYKTKNKNFKNEDEVKEWMILNQFGRRNLSNYQRSVLALELEDVFSKKAKERMLSGNPVLKSEQGRTIEKIGKVANVGKDTIAKVKKIQEKAPEEIKAKLSTGEVSINAAYKKLNQVEKTNKLNNKKQENLQFYKNDITGFNPTVYNKDCIDYLNTLENNSVNLLITDPPYSTDVSDIERFADSWVNLALSKVKQSGRAFICIGAYPKEINAYLNILLNQFKFVVDNPLIWTYKNTLGVTPKMKYNLNYQVILHLYSDKFNNKSYPLDTSITNEMFNVQEINAPDGRLGNRFHTWQKPDELALRLIKHTTKENDIVIDPFTCTGTFLLMAAKMKRKAEGCDISKENLQIAKERGCTIVGI